MTKEEFKRKFENQHGEGTLVIMRSMYHKTYLPKIVISRACGLSYRQTKYWLNLGEKAGYFVRNSVDNL